MRRKKVIGLTMEEVLGMIGFWGLIAIGVYLVLKKLGIVESLGTEELVIGVVATQGFYNSYLYGAVHDIDRRLNNIDEKLEQMTNLLKKRKQR